MSQLTAIRLLDADEPTGPLLEAVRDLAEGHPNQATYQVETDSFPQVPFSPFAYWVSNQLRGLFTQLPSFEQEDRLARTGLQTNYDFRWIRLVWEIPSKMNRVRWFPFAKGGEYSKFFSSIHLMVNWQDTGKPIKEWKRTELSKGRITENNSKCWNETKYFREGITWTNSTTCELSVRTLPRGCVFAHRGPSAFCDESEIIPILGLIHSSIIAVLIKMQQGLADAGRKNYEVGIINRLPFPLLDEGSKTTLGDSAQSAWSLKRSTDTANQTSHAFYAPALSPGQFGSRNKKATTT